MKTLSKLRDPVSVEEGPAALTQAYARDDARRSRELAIYRVDSHCQGAGCNYLGWSHARREALELRPKEPVGGKPSTGFWVFCPACANAHDKKKAKRRRAP
jgi:hypothetical protein